MVLQYIILGFSIALPIGAISIEISKESIRNGFLKGWMVGIGAIMVDIFLLFLLNIGFADFLMRFEVILWALGAFFLAQLAWQSFKESQDTSTSMFSSTENRSLINNFIRGLKVGINPGNIIFWMSVLGTSVVGAASKNEVSLILISFAILIGIALHDVILSMVMSLFSRFVNQKTNKVISIVAGLILLGFAVYFADNCYKEVVELAF